MITFQNDYTKICFMLENQHFFIKSISFKGKEFIYYEQGIKHSNVFIVGEGYRQKIMGRYSLGGEELFFVSYIQEEYENKKELVVEEKNEKIYVKTIYSLYNNSAVLQCRKEITNLMQREILLENAAPLVLTGIMLDEKTSGIRMEAFNEDDDPTAVVKEVKQAKKQTLPKFWKGHNTWCSEGCFECFDLETEGFRAMEKKERCCRIVVAGNGTQTTNRYFPVGIFEKENQGFFMFEILPVGSWSYEITTGLDDAFNEWCLSLSGKTLNDNGWYKVLKENETYETEIVRIVGASDLDGIIAEQTAIRRNEKIKTSIWPHEKVIHNMFMQNVYANPSEKIDEKYIPLVGDIGADYYVVDAGWFDDMNTRGIGIWNESQISYPSGFQKTIDKVRAKGMKFGLWVELQSIGTACEDKNVLPEKCFFHIHGHRPVCTGRYQLNYAVKETRIWADGIIKKVVERYKPDYIKIDYNQTAIGTDCEQGSLTEGLAMHARAYLKWFEKVQKKYPNIIFESCSSGGMFMDSNIASLTSVFSISDQNGYLNYPVMINNLPCVTLPEQMGVWAIPVNRFEYPKAYDEEVIMSVINTLYGVMHSCSKLEALTDSQKELFKEGIQYYRDLSEVKKQAVAILPRGFASLYDKVVITGLKHNKKLYISVYNLSDTELEIEQDFRKYEVKEAILSYPKHAKNVYCLKDGILKCTLSAKSARVFELNA